MVKVRQGIGTLAALLGVAGTASVVETARADVILNIVNQRPDSDTVPAYVTFGGGNPVTATAVINGVPTSLVKGQSYALSSIAPGSLTVSQATSNKVIVSLGQPLMSVVQPDGYAVNFNSPAVPTGQKDGQNNEITVPNADYGVRFDKVELSVAPGQGGGANLSSTDFIAIPLQLSAANGTTLGWSKANTIGFFPLVMTQLAQAAGFSVLSSSNANGALVVSSNAPPGTVPAPNSPTDKAALAVYDPATNSVISGLVRIISPTTTPANLASPYASFQPYINTIVASGKTTTIEGYNANDNSIFSNYSLQTRFAPADTTLGGIAVKQGDLVFQGTTWNNPAGSPGAKQDEQPFVMVIPRAALTDQAIYGANLGGVTVLSDGTEVIAGPGAANPTATPIQTAIREKALGDFFAGLHFGFIGSTASNPTGFPDWTGKPIGDSPSWTWYGNQPGGVQASALDIKYAYCYAQPQSCADGATDKFFNVYSSLLNTSPPVTDSYASPYPDRLTHPLLSFDNGNTLTLTILADEVNPFITLPEVRVPEPVSLTLFGIGLLGLGLGGGSRARASTR